MKSWRPIRKSTARCHGRLGVSVHLGEQSVPRVTIAPGDARLTSTRAHPSPPHQDFERAENVTKADAATSADRLVYKVSIALVLAAVCIFASNTWVSQLTQQGLQPRDGLRVFNVVEITPLYNGESSTWDEVNAAVAQGRAGIQLVYNDDSMSLVAVFDTQAQRDEWVCSPAAPTLLRDRPCPGV